MNREHTNLNPGWRIYPFFMDSKIHWALKNVWVLIEISVKWQKKKLLPPLFIFIPHVLRLIDSHFQFKKFIFLIKYSHHAHQVAAIEKWKLIREVEMCESTIFMLCVNIGSSTDPSSHHFIHFLYLNCLQINVYLKQRNSILVFALNIRNFIFLPSLTSLELAFDIITSQEEKKNNRNKRGLEKGTRAYRRWN